MAKDKNEPKVEEPEAPPPSEQSADAPEQQPKPFEAKEADPGPSTFDLQFPKK